MEKKIRKNAKKQIQGLLKQATKILFSGKESNAVEVLEWLEDSLNYREAEILLTSNEDGSPSEMKIRGGHDCLGSFNITFEPLQLEETKEEEQELVEIESAEITVRWSDTDKLDSTTTYTIEEYNNIIKNEQDGIQSFLNMNLSNGDVLYTRHDLIEKNRSLEDELFFHGYKVKQETIKDALSGYKERQDTKKEKQVELSLKASNLANQKHQESNKLSRAFDMGQPILVGHHSEKKARRLQETMHNKIRQSIELDKKAEYHQAKADSTGGGGIASDDPEAIDKIKAKLNKLVKLQEDMKFCNKIIRSSYPNKVERIMEKTQIPRDKAEQLFMKDAWGGIGFPHCTLTNNNNKIKQAKKRIEALENMHNSGTIDERGDGWIAFMDDGRIHIDFDIKPEEEVRSLLKQYGFKWSPKRKTWVRKITPNAVYKTQQLLKVI